MTTALVLLSGWPVAAPAQTADTGLTRALRYVDAATAEYLRVEGTPGLALAVVAEGRVVAVRCYGVTDVVAATPVTADTRFLAGSISKTFTAIALLQLQEEGLVDVRRPVADYLPWFKVRSPGGPLTLHHLLTHTAGLPRDRSDLPSSPYTAIALRERQLGAAPGERFAYSNIGYQLLSLVIEEVEGRSFSDIIRTRVLEPLSLKATEPAVTQEGRLTAATGYQYLFDDRPPFPGQPLVPVSWTENTAGDANIVTTAPDLARLLLALLGQGRGPGTRLLQPVSFGRMVQRTVPAPELGTDTFYGYGLVLGMLAGDPIIWHSGGMPGFRAVMLGDLDEQLGVVLLANGPGAARSLAEYALAALIAARRGKLPPPVPIAADPVVIPGAADYAGRFVDSSGAVVNLVAAPGRLFLESAGRRIPLVRAGPDAFLAADPAWDRFPLRVGRRDGVVVELVHGGRWYAGDRYQGPRRWTSPPAWQAYVGHYRALTPYSSNYRIVLRQGALLLVSPEGIEEPLSESESGEFQVGLEPHAVERVRFADVISGRALRMNLSGTEYYRTTTP